MRLNLPGDIAGARVGSGGETCPLGVGGRAGGAQVHGRGRVVRFPEEAPGRRPYECECDHGDCDQRACACGEPFRDWKGAQAFLISCRICESRAAESRRC